MIRRFFILVHLVALGLVGCTPSGTEVERSRLSFHINSEPVTLDPSRVEDGLGIRLIVNLMDGLTGFNSRGELKNRLARKIEVSSDLKTYKCVIRDDAVWSDGVSVDGSQIQLGIERALKPETGSKLSGLLKWIEGAEAFASGKSPTVSGHTRF
jgi:ABC-type oligopeptide transport system substrate-binding subunit